MTGMKSLSLKTNFYRAAQSRLFVRVLFAISVALLIATVFSWWYFVYGSSDRVFWRMIDTSLSTASFTRTIAQDDSYQQVRQVTATRTVPDQVAFSSTRITQGESSEVDVTTENLGTPRQDFVRYTAIKAAPGDVPADLDAVLNVWGKATTVGNDTNGQIYNQSVLNIIPFGNLNKQDRIELLGFIKENNVYNFQLKETKRDSLISRPLLVYEVQVDPKGYVETLQLYAQKVGLTQLASVDTAMYEGAERFVIDVTIDGWTNRLAEVSYEDGARVERLSAYGVRHEFPSIPEDAIPYEELQGRLWSE